MSAPRIVGVVPVLPWPLGRWTWLTAAVPAERLAALRVGVALVLLVDIVGSYLPRASAFFGIHSLGSPEVFAEASRPHWRWSVLRGIESHEAWNLVLLAWVGAAICLLLGLRPRLMACVCWVLSVSVFNTNFYIHNSGDNVRSIVLFYLMLSPSGAAWSPSARWGQMGADERPVHVSGWPVRMLFLQLVLIYFLNGVYKLTGSEWRAGNVMHWVMGNLGWTRMSFAWLPSPEWFLALQAWTVLVWEVLFPLLVMMPMTRVPALVLGVVFHLGTAVTLQLGPFPFYMICLYLPLIPWERLGNKTDHYSGNSIPAPQPTNHMPLTTRHYSNIGP